MNKHLHKATRVEAPEQWSVAIDLKCGGDTGTSMTLILTVVERWNGFTKLDHTNGGHVVVWGLDVKPKGVVALFGDIFSGAFSKPETNEAEIMVISGTPYLLEYFGKIEVEEELEMTQTL